MTSLFGAVALLVNQLLDFFDQINNGMSREIFVLLTTLITIIIFQPLFSLIHRLVDNFFNKKENHQNNLIKNFTFSRIGNTKVDTTSKDDYIPPTGNISGSGNGGGNPYLTGYNDDDNVKGKPGQNN